MTQLDLFADAEAQTAKRDQAEWAATFERAEWVAPWDCADGTPKGTVVLGWRCPDPACRRVEVTSYALAINHGWDPDIPGRKPFDDRCQRLKLLASQWRAKFKRTDCKIDRFPTVRGWVCPACGVVEPNLFTLWQNHGLDPEQRDPDYDGSCHEVHP